MKTVSFVLFYGDLRLKLLHQQSLILDGTREEGQKTGLKVPLTDRDLKNTIRHRKPPVPVCYDLFELEVSTDHSSTAF